MKKIRSLLSVLAASACVPAMAAPQTYQVKDKDIRNGYVIEKIWLQEYGMPAVTVSGITYIAGAKLPAGAHTGDPAKIEVAIGIENKKPFAVVRVPAYAAGTGDGIQQVSGFTLDVVAAPAGNKPLAKTAAAGVTASVLSTGTWYKIAVTNTGFHKIDYTLINSLGISPASVDPANIRVFGNGGNMLPVDNAQPRAADLTENSIMVSDNGDNTFNDGEYAVFYAVGPTEWDKDSVNQRFVHQNNLYSDTAFYFITFDHGAGLRIPAQGTAPAANVTVNSFNTYAVHDLDLLNPAAIGQTWYGEEYSQDAGNTTQTFSFDMGGYVGNAYCSVFFASTSGSGGSSFSASLNGAKIGSGAFALPTGVNDNVMDVAVAAATVPCNAQVAAVTVNFMPSDASSLGFLNYIEINARRPLSISGDQTGFRDWQSVGAGNVAGYQLAGATSSTRVWDVTDPQSPVLMNGSLSGSTYTFAQDASRLHEFAAMNSANLYSPKYVGKVTNQNLHAPGQPQCIIVAYPGFIDAANKLADYHRSHDNMNVVVATTAQIYNEFSSGGQDIAAIRDYVRMFYDRAADATQLPRYLVLFGGASYDYKNRLNNNSNFVPVFESAETSNDLNAFSGDDFYGFLDANENINNNALLNVLDIGVGRLPARSIDDANALVNKITGYTSPATLGPWRLSSTFVADNNDDAGRHMDDAEAMAYTVTNSSANLYNEGKVYIDAIPTVSTPAGERAPNANAAIDGQVFNGTFMINYNGHGNTEVWATERILTQDDYYNWTNTNMLPFMVTATCDFGQFDHPEYVSAAEQLVTRGGGGVIAVLTTTAAVYASYNHELNVQYLAAQYTRNPDSTWNTFGDASRIGKNATYISSKDPSELANFRKFSLLGDPALTPDFPQYNIKIDSVNDGATQTHADTIKALGAYVITGSVHDNNGNLLSGFNGNLSVSFFDKPRSITTISGTDEVFKLQDNLVYRGRVSVTNGVFSFTFIAPKDINYYFGSGKISTYAENGVTDAAGTESSFAVGGYSDNPVISTDPPIVKAYINDSLFRNGGITGTNTSLFVSLYDFTGINVTGSVVGHDLTAVLDGNTEAPYILNNYYETAPNTYQRGFISFPISGIPDGRHTIVVKAWDVNDNVGEGSVDFTVVDGTVVDIQNLMNYPNPFNNTTHFVFEHNHPEEALNAQIEIYNTAGSLVKKINENYTAAGSRSNEVTWDGTDNNGARLPSGVYVYRLNITSEKGFKSSAYQKLVIVR